MQSAKYEPNAGLIKAVKRQASSTATRRYLNSLPEYQVTEELPGDIARKLKKLNAAELRKK